MIEAVARVLEEYIKSRAEAQLADECVQRSKRRRTATQELTEDDEEARRRPQPKAQHDQQIDVLTKVMHDANAKNPLKNGDGICRIMRGDIVRVTVEEVDDASGAKACTGKRSWGVGIVNNARFGAVTVMYWYIDGKRERKCGAPASSLLPVPPTGFKLVAMDVVPSSLSREITATFL